MSIPYIQPTMSQARAVGADVQYPFLGIGDTETKVYVMRCMQLATSYSSSQVALDTTMTSASAAGVIELPFSADSQAYFVGDTGHAYADAMVSFNRTFANIPKPTRNMTGGIGFIYPGLGDSLGTTSTATISGLSMIFGTTGVRFTTITDLTLSVGDTVELSVLRYNDTGSTYVHAIDGEVVVKSVIDSKNFTADIGRYFDEQKYFDVLSGSVTRRAAPNRAQLQRNVPVIESKTYILPGVTAGISAPEDVIVPPVFAPYKIVEGSPTTFTRVSQLTSTTWPTDTQYQTMQKNGDHIVVESLISEWKGNILEQTVRTVKAL